MGGTARTTTGGGQAPAGAFPRPRDRHGGGRLLRHLRRPSPCDPVRTGDPRRFARSGARAPCRSPHRRVEFSGNKVTGIAVHTGARVASLAGRNEVLVSATVRDLVSGSRIEFEDRG